MNSLDQERLDAAMGIISNAADLVGRLPADPSVDRWREAARAWLDQYRVSPAGSAGWGDADVGSRWRDIDSTGEIATDPTPDPPDDPDEGETGPPEQQG